MNYVNILFSTYVQKPILGNDLSNVFKTVQMVPFYSVCFDIGLGKYLDFVLLNLSPFSHEKQFLFGVVVKRGESVNLNVDLVNKLALVVESDNVQPVHEIED